MTKTMSNVKTNKQSMTKNKTQTSEDRHNTHTTENWREMSFQKARNVIDSLVLHELRTKFCPNAAFSGLGCILHQSKWRIKQRQPTFKFKIPFKSCLAFMSAQRFAFASSLLFSFSSHLVFSACLLFFYCSVFNFLVLYTRQE
jgi:hypothetical protein